MRLLLAAGVLAAWSDFAAAQDWPGPEISVTDYGIYVAERVRTEFDPHAPNGVRGFVADHRFIETTRDICARVGLSFGFELRQGVGSSGIWRLTVDIDHPPILGIDGRIHVREHATVSLGSGPLLTGWSYHHIDALVEGDWIWTVTYRGQPVTRQVFHIQTNCLQPVA